MDDAQQFSVIDTKKWGKSGEEGLQPSAFANKASLAGLDADGLSESRKKRFASSSKLSRKCRRVSNVIERALEPDESENRTSEKAVATSKGRVCTII